MGGSGCGNEKTAPGALVGVLQGCRPSRVEATNFRVSSQTLWDQDTTNPSPRCPGRQKEPLVANCRAVLCGGLQDPTANIKARVSSELGWWG